MSKTIELLQRTAEEAVAHNVTAICLSAASFIAEIDADSRDVAAYLEQRFGAALRTCAPHVFRNMIQDGRQLVGWRGRK